MCGQSDPSWFKAVLVVLPVASAFGGVLLTNRNNRKINKESFEEERAKSKRHALQERGAELYIILDEWSEAVALASDRLRNSAMAGNDLNRSDLETMRERTRLLRAKFIVDVYFPAFTSLMSKVGDLFITLGDETLAAIQPGHKLTPERNEEIYQRGREFTRTIFALTAMVTANIRETLQAS